MRQGGLVLRSRMGRWPTSFESPLPLREGGRGRGFVPIEPAMSGNVPILIGVGLVRIRARTRA
ncbi:hypothetical protein P409_35620, partial [Inquilinus limosus MP06]